MGTNASWKKGEHCVAIPYGSGASCLSSQQHFRFQPSDVLWESLPFGFHGGSWSVIHFSLMIALPHLLLKFFAFAQSSVLCTHHVSLWNPPALPQMDKKQPRLSCPSAPTTLLLPLQHQTDHRCYLYPTASASCPFHSLCSQLWSGFRFHHLMRLDALVKLPMTSMLPDMFGRHFYMKRWEARWT